MLSRLSHSFFLSFRLHLFLLVQILLLTSSFSSATVVKKQTVAPASYAGEIAYQKVADLCHRLMQDTTANRGRKDWLKAATELDQVYQKYPRSRTAPACLHLAARLRISMYQRFRQPGDQDQAVALFHNVVALFPQSSEAADALYAIAEIEQINGNLRDAAKTYYRLTQTYPFSPRKAQAEDKLSQLTAIAKSLAARKNGHRPPPAVTAQPKKKIAQSRSASKPATVASAEPVWEPIFSEPVVKNRAATPSQKTKDWKVSASALTAKKVPPPSKPASPPEQPSSQWREWKPVVSSAPEPAIKKSSATPSQRQKETAPPSPTLAEKKVFSPLTSVSTPSKPKPEQVAVPKINFSELKIAEPNDSVIPQKTKETPPPAPSKPKNIAKTETKAKSVQTEEEKESFWGRILPDFMLGSDNEENKKAEQATAQQKTATSEQIKKSATTPTVSKTEPAPVAAQVKPVTPKVAANKPEKAAPDTSKIVVSALQIATMEPTKPPEQKTPSVTPQSAPAKETAKPAEIPLADLRPIQHWSSDRYSRVAVSTSGPVLYHVELPDRSSDQPGELRIDFERSHLPTQLQTLLEIKNDLITSIHAEQITQETVRVAIKLANTADAKIFSLNDPFRVVIDLRSLATSAPEQTVAQAKDEKDEKKAEVLLKTQSKVKATAPDKLTLAQQLGLGIKRIVIDPGHGGKDTGAIAFGLKEKNIVLNVAKRVRKILKQEHYEVFLTRDKDVFIPLEERTAIANTKGADLFLSIHVNAHPKSWVRGVETFYLNLAANPEAMRVAALENATSSRSMSEMEGILTDLMKNTKIKESSQLAEFIQTSMAEGLRSYKTRSLGVKKAPFYVLIGAQMPAALSEISFITNKKEAKLLKDDTYLQTIAEQIATGVIAYIEHRRTAATAALNLQPTKEEM